MAATDRGSTLHSIIQRSISELAIRSGFLVKTEARGNGWRADVLATSESRKVAFEVQTSSASHADLLRRQARYAHEGIDCCWLVKSVPRACRTESPELPVFRVLKSNDGIQVALIDDRRLLPLQDFVTDYLRGGIQFRRTMTVAAIQEVHVVFFEMDCWKCGSAYHAYYVKRPYVSCCNYEFDDSEFSELWGDHKLQLRPEIISAVRDFLQSDYGSSIGLGVIKTRYSHTVDKEYDSFGCPDCDAILGDWYYHNAALDAGNDEASLPSFSATVITDSEVFLDLPHWCYPTLSHCLELPSIPKEDDDQESPEPSASRE